MSESEKKRDNSKPPWYYYLAGMVVLSVITVAMEMVFKLRLGALPYALLFSFVGFSLPRWIWKDKLDRQGIQTKEHLKPDSLPEHTPSEKEP